VTHKSHPSAARDWAGRLLVLLALIAAGCSRFDVRAKRDPTFDFARLRTFAWLPPAEAEPADQRVNDRGIDRRIRAATENQLRAKGYSPADSGAADMLLNYRLTATPTDVPRPGGSLYTRGLWGGWPTAAEVYESYDVGTLYVAVLDGTTKQMVWVGAARARLLPHISYEDRVKRVDAAVEKLFADFPSAAR